MKYLIERVIFEIQDIKNNRRSYNIKLEFIVTNFDQVQLPHLDMWNNRNMDKFGWIVNFPLTKNEEYLYIYPGDFTGD